MKKISSILLAVDGDHDDDALLEEVEIIAAGNDARVTLLSIADPPGAIADRNIATANLERWERQIRTKQLENLASTLTEENIPVTIEHAAGKPYLEIIRKVIGGDFDLVVKPAQKEVGIKEYLMGGTDMQLLSLCPEAVWIFQPTANRVLNKIAVAVDLQPDDKERTALALNLLEWAEQIARSADAEVHVIHAWQLYREASLRSGAAITGVIDDLVENKERVHRQQLSDALHQVGLNGANVFTHLIKGSPKEQIPILADDLAVDLLIMGTVGRTGIPGFFIGNTADTVLRKVQCSVLAVKPENFSTPVKQAAREQRISA